MTDIEYDSQSDFIEDQKVEKYIKAQEVANEWPDYPYND